MSHVISGILVSYRTNPKRPGAPWIRAIYSIRWFPLAAHSTTRLFRVGFRAEGLGFRVAARSSPHQHVGRGFSGQRRDVKGALKSTITGGVLRAMP